MAGAPAYDPNLVREDSAYLSSLYPYYGYEGAKAVRSRCSSAIPTRRGEPAPAPLVALALLRWREAQWIPVAERRLSIARSCRRHQEEGAADVCAPSRCVIGAASDAAQDLWRRVRIAHPHARRLVEPVLLPPGRFAGLLVPLATRFASLVAWSGPGADTSGAPVSVCLILDSSDISVSSATIEERGSIPRWGQRVNRPPPAPP